MTPSSTVAAVGDNAVGILDSSVGNAVGNAVDNAVGILDSSVGNAVDNAVACLPSLLRSRSWRRGRTLSLSWTSSRADFSTSWTT